ncbi:MAG: ECF transporter S component [Clostridiales bacterium]|nr:ECF transporter S component [Clostridiales bacterium]
MSNTSSNSLQVRRMVYAALCLALALVLPFLTGQIPQIGSALCPMHIPVLLCGFLCGWPWGLAVGFIAPLLRSVVFGMPPMVPGAIAMAFELATYGAVAGFLYRKLPKKLPWIYVSLLIAMIAGRAVWGVARLILAGIQGNGFTFAMFISGAITTAIPGIIVQLILIPAIVYALEKAGLNLNKG